MDSQIVMNEKLEMGYVFGNLKESGMSFMGSFGAFLDWDLPVTNAIQEQGSIKVETSNGIASTNMDIFYGLIFKGTIKW